MLTALRWISYPILLLLGLVLMALALAAILVALAYPQLPSLEVLTDYHPKIPLRVFTAEGDLIGEFGEERRALVRISAVPEVMKLAIIAAEDERFYRHPGVDTLGVLRAAMANFTSGGKKQGASTITMQVARNFFLSSEKTLTRKFYEALLAYKIENSLSKDQIFEIYVNQIYLGQRAYGFAAAAQIYFGKPLGKISLAEAAMLAGLPKAPSSYNPVANPKRAKLRQLYVLQRMRVLGFIDETQHSEAQKENLHVRHEINSFSVHAQYVAEMARQIVYERYQEEAYTRGLRVITTIHTRDQEAAYESLRRGVIAYDRRHGYRGAVGFVDLDAADGDPEETLEEALLKENDSDDLLAAVILQADTKRIRATLRDGETVQIAGDGLKFALPMIDAKAPANRRLRRGAIIYVQKDGKGAWQIAQLPEVEAAFVSANPKDGAIHALVGGFDFNRNKFNHVTQAWRQPGSSFKPFIFSAALEKGYMPSSVFLDEPLVIPASVTGSQPWAPRNYDGKYGGPMSMRTGLAKSKNLIAIRILQAIGTRYTQDYVTRFGFDAEKHPPYLTMALGAGSVTVWQQLTGYSVFANGGYRIRPYVVKQILDNRGHVLAESQPPQAGSDPLRVLDPRNAYLMDSMLRDVVRRGTAARALSLKRGDLAGKTGTTNDFVDAWFCGYQPDLVGIAWIGFDQPRKLGNGETGSTAALPIWMGYMEKALQGVPESFMEQPEGLVTVSVPADSDGEKPRDELIYRESLPPPPPPDPGEELFGGGPPVSIHYPPGKPLQPE